MAGVDISSSILNATKSAVGVMPDDTAFDVELIMHINTTLMILEQLGLPPYQITSAAETWNDYLSGSADYNAVQSYIFLEVSALFDPPSNSFVSEARNRIKDELGWRLLIECNSASTDGGTTGA